MKSIKTAIAMSTIAWSGVSFAANGGDNATHALFVMTNNADSNQVIAFSLSTQPVRRISILP
jgi:hypothetical protein